MNKEQEASDSSVRVAKSLGFIITPPVVFVVTTAKGE
jgi:hypothetical protein